MIPYSRELQRWNEAMQRAAEIERAERPHRDERIVVSFAKSWPTSTPLPPHFGVAIRSFAALGLNLRDMEYATTVVFCDDGEWDSDPRVSQEEKSNGWPA